MNESTFGSPQFTVWRHELDELFETPIEDEDEDENEQRLSMRMAMGSNFF
jgi:hypothetical protein